MQYEEKPLLCFFKNIKKNNFIRIGMSFRKLLCFKTRTPYAMLFLITKI